MQYPSSSPLPSGTPLGNGPKVQYNQGISNCSNYCTLQDDCITHQLPTMPFTNVSSHGNNNVQFSPLHRPQQPHNNVQYPPVNVLPEPSVKPLNHSDDNPLPKGKNCAVYDPTAPTGCRIKYYQRSHRKKKDNINDIATKLNELKMDCEKPPIAKLNEIMLLKKKSVEYNLVSIAGPVHTPVYTYNVKSDGVIAYGSGSSKKDAKKNAALAFMDRMDCINDNSDITSTTSSQPSPIENSTEKILEFISEINPVGVLQETCMARHWELPDYEFSYSETNESHNPWYTVACSLRIYRTKGEGKTKQAAKRQAARFMYDRIKSLTQEEIDACYHSKSQTPNNNSQPNKTKKYVYNMENPPNDSPYFLKHIGKFYEQLKLSKNACINQLKTTKCIKDFSKSAVDVLDNISEEEGFNTTYVMISEKSRGIGVMVQVSINPAVVHVGTGDTVEHAQEIAAYTTLLYIKLMIEE